MASEMQTDQTDSNDYNQDNTDAKSWTDDILKKLSRPDPLVATMPVERDAEQYNMRHKERGKAVIFNNKDFMDRGLNSRNGTDADRDRLESILKDLKFEVTVYNNAKKLQIQDVIRKLAHEDHSNRDCLLVAVFSHGDLKKIHAYDDYYQPEELWESFSANSCKSLAGKPKIFLIQACQGDQLDCGTVLTARSRTMVDGRAFDNQYTVPNKADFLTVYSTVPGYYSWRNTSEGSWFIQSVCNVLKQHADNKDFLSMLTIVARHVALNFESNVPGNPQFDRKKQVPLITSTLTRDIYFNTK